MKGKLLMTPEPGIILKYLTGAYIRESYLI